MTRPTDSPRFSVTLACALLLFSAGSIAAPSDEDIAAGRAIAEDRNAGNCFACHHAEGAELAGNIGPPLVAMKMRFPYGPGDGVRG